MKRIIKSVSVNHALKLLVLTLLTATLCCFGQVIVTPTTENKEDIAAEAKSIEVIGKYAGEWRKWMWIGRINTTMKPEEGFHPSMTFILSDYEPVVKKLRNGKWQIQFTSPIAKDIP